MVPLSNENRRQDPADDMSIVYRIEDGVAFVLWDGLVKADEWLTHVRRLVADPAWPQSRALHLSDLRSADIDESINQAVLTEAAGLFGSHNRIQQLRAAIVAGMLSRRRGCSRI